MKKYMLIYFLISVSSLYSQWEFIGLDSMVVRQIQVFGDTIWAGTAVHTIQSQVSGLYRSTNKGKDWTQIDTTLGEGAIGSLNFHPNNHNVIYLIKALNSPYGADGTLYKSIDGGKIWNKINADNNPIKWFNISLFNDNKLYAVDGINNEVFKSVDGGNNWNQISAFPVSSHGRFTAFNFSLVKDSLLFAYVDIQFYQAFYKSTNDGYSWQYIGQPPLGPQEIWTDNELDCRIYLQSFFITDDCGLNWTQTDSIFTQKPYYLSLYVDTASSKLYIAKSTGIYVSDRRTLNWEKLSGSENLPLNIGDPGFVYTIDVGHLRNIFLQEKTMYVGTTSGIYKKADITDVSDENNFENANFFLAQNYPNPFNPTTKISFTIPQKSQIKLKVFDVLGREAANLAEGVYEAGKYEVTFDASNLPSGVYFYSLTTASSSISKKMLLIK